MTGGRTRNTKDRSAVDGLPLFEQGASLRPRALTVTEITASIKTAVETGFTSVWVQGEISNFRNVNSSGHAYFSLKDDGAVLPAAVFGWAARGRRNPKLAFELKDGLQVLCQGRLSVYAPSGRYQLVIEHIEPLGAGALQLAFEQLKAKLVAEGLFAPQRKRPLPGFPKTIAVVTSPTGAAIRDMLSILARRARHIKVVIIPALVQGDEAPGQLVRGIQAANRLEGVDLLVVARGGGSIEDLWSFNDERLARAIAASRLPVVSAVGHEIDFTISDFVADLRAPTPSAAAEIISGKWVDSLGTVRDASSRLRQAVLREISARKSILAHVLARLVSPRDRLREQAQKCDDFLLRLERAMGVKLEAGRSAFGRLAAKLDALSPLKVLERGYAIIRGARDGSVVRAASDASPGLEVRIRFHDGEKDARIV